MLPNAQLHAETGEAGAGDGQQAIPPSLGVKPRFEGPDEPFHLGVASRTIGVEIVAAPSAADVRDAVVSADTSAAALRAHRHQQPRGNLSLHSHHAIILPSVGSDKALTLCVTDACSWADRIERAARLTVPDQEAVRAAGRAPQGRRTTAGLLAACIVGESAGCSTSSLIGRDDLLLAASAGLVSVPEPVAGEGSIQHRSADDVIELWTERELTMVHAAWLLEGWTDIAERSARWLINEIQPDNATNLPWAVQVFASLSIQDGSAEARLYAETLLHNCMVSAGRPDPLSALILLDAARQLRVRYAG